jgi:acetoin utilization protein AcuC
VIWDPSFLAYDHGGDHPMHPVRLDLTIRLARALGVLDGVDLIAPPPATDAELCRIHTAEYLAAVRAAPRTGPIIGHGLGTEDNPIFERMHDAAAAVTGGTLAAAQALHDGAQRAVNIAGGLHHAMPDHASGFCVYNDCAVAISWLLDHGVERIAYLDVDVHHGDGVQAAFADDPRVLTVSVHQHPRTLWPGTGHSTDVGTGAAAGTSVNLPLPPGTGDGHWLRAFSAVVPSLVRTFKPEVLVTQCGVDTHREDPLADLALTVDGQRAVFRALRELVGSVPGCRWLVLGGGGYGLYRVVPRSWTHLLATVLDRDIPAGTAIPADWIAYGVPLAGGVPLPTTMGEGGDPSFEPWSGDVTVAVDRYALATRRAVFPLHGLDPDDPRD